MPNLCFLCGIAHAKTATLCSDCIKDLPLNSSACPACARANSASRLCRDCRVKPWPSIDHCHALLSYQYPVNYLIQAAKFRQNLSLANSLGQLVCRDFSSDRVKPDCIMPVPLHFRRLISRGYNQSVEIARPLANMLRVKLDLHSCKRIRATPPQSNLPAHKRKHNVRNAFLVNKQLTYKHVLLIDDVITTGNTVNEVARVLSKAGVARIEVLACARAS